MVALGSVWDASKTTIGTEIHWERRYLATGSLRKHARLQIKSWAIGAWHCCGEVMHVLLAMMHRRIFDPAVDRVP